MIQISLSRANDRAIYCTFQAFVSPQVKVCISVVCIGLRMLLSAATLTQPIEPLSMINNTDVFQRNLVQRALFDFNWLVTSFNVAKL